MSSRAALLRAPVPLTARALGWLLLAPATAACTPLAEPEPVVLELRSVLPRVSEGVYLNEPLVFYFSDALDRSSVTSSSVSIKGPGGRSARGRFEVDGDSLRFVPARVYARELDDGGFAPGTRYEVRLAGFPDPGALRSASGAPLAHGWSWSFLTVPSDEGAVFQDDSPQRGSPLVVADTSLTEQEPVLLACGEPLDPSTLRDEDFRLLSGQDVLRVVTRLVPRPDRPDLAPIAPGGAWIELSPLEPLQAGRTYRVAVAPDLALRDYGRNPIWFQEADSREIRVTPAAAARRGEHRESFLDTTLRSPLVPPAYGARRPDGAAYWSDEGSVRVRFPAAAGTGADGEVELRPNDERVDVHATRLVLPESGECRLAGAGTIVLRSQTSLRLSGRLLRATGWAEEKEGEREKRRQEGDAETGFDDSGMIARTGSTLSAFLESARASGTPWTVLVAGGDVVLDGDLSFDTPVLCAAGGVVRVTGTLTHPPNEFWILGEGGGSRLERAPLVMDEPLENPLVVPLELAVLSGPLPRSGGRVRRWLEADVRGHAGSGSYRVRFVAEPEGPAGFDRAQPVDVLRLLDAPQIRFWIQLTVQPRSGPAVIAAPWDPPFVDEVTLTWEVDE